MALAIHSGLRLFDTLLILKHSKIMQKRPLTKQAVLPIKPIFVHGLPQTVWKNLGERWSKFTSNFGLKFEIPRLVLDI